jgi:hypothetical protein
VAGSRRELLIVGTVTQTELDEKKSKAKMDNWSKC